MLGLASRAERERWEAARDRLRQVLEKLLCELRRLRRGHNPNRPELERKWQTISDLRYRLSMHDRKTSDAILSVDWERFAFSGRRSMAHGTKHVSASDACRVVPDCSLKRVGRPR
jgi:hypothetical protein